MTVTNVEQDPKSLRLEITAEFDVSAERVWQMWADPRRLERWWGPPTHPATFVDHELETGATVTYYMTGPGGEQHHGWWRILAVEPPHRIEFEDGFADQSGEPNPEMPTTTTRVSIDQPAGITRMTISSIFGSLEEMERLIAMGVVEGITAAVSQIDELLAVEA